MKQGIGRRGSISMEKTQGNGEDLSLQQFLKEEDFLETEETSPPSSDQKIMVVSCFQH